MASTFEGKPNDSAFNWSDDRIYCSELVWKIFHRALKIGTGDLRKLKEFDLSRPEVQKQLRGRYPGGGPSRGDSHFSSGCLSEQPDSHSLPAIEN